MTVHVPAWLTLSHPVHSLKTEVSVPEPVAVGTRETMVPLAYSKVPSLERDEVGSDPVPGLATTMPVPEPTKSTVRLASDLPEIPIFLRIEIADEESISGVLLKNWALML